MESKHGPEYLRGEDLQKDGRWAEFSVKISEVMAPDTVKSADGSLIDKPILVFEGATKHLILGNTNERLIKAQLGTKPKEWIGRVICLHPVVGNWFGVRNAIALRVRIPDGAPQPFIQPNARGKDITGQLVNRAPSYDSNGA